jgi:HAD superfamily hydrolase (TIGR01484 family)
MSRPLPPPLAHCPTASWRAVRGVLTDIDDTLTRDGTIEPEALAALHALQAAGVPTLAITGRPQGWSEPFAREWPLRAIVAENGAVALWREGGALKIDYAQDAATRQHHAKRLREVAARVLREVPGAQLARDSAGRVTDIAIDHSEFAHLPPEAVEQVVALMRHEGMVATVSSIHINGWFGQHSKRSGAQWMAQRLLGADTEAHPQQWLYVGDSTNDQTMFAHFPLSVGVANLLRFSAQLQHWPAYLSPGERGVGFSQAVQALLAARA